MAEYITRRVGWALLTIIVMSAISFAVIQLPPGDYLSTYIAMMASMGSEVTAAEVKNLTIQYGLDKPVYVQYFKWLGMILRGNFGMSMEWMRPVLEVIGDRLGLTIAVSLGALFVTWGFALPIGIYSAVKQYSIGDYFFTFVGFIGIATPNFLLALILLYLGFKYFGVRVGGLFSPEYQVASWSWGKLWDLIRHLPLPALVLGLGSTAQLMRIMRANLLDELHKPYVVTARAKGLSEFRLIMKYPVRVALNPFISRLAYIFRYIVSGSIIVSLVLSLPTIGPLLLKSLLAQDMYLASTLILLLGTMTVVGTLISDILLMIVDPRIRYEGGQ